MSRKFLHFPLKEKKNRKANNRKSLCSVFLFLISRIIRKIKKENRRKYEYFAFSIIKRRHHRHYMKSIVCHGENLKMEKNSTFLHEFE